MRVIILGFGGREDVVREADRLQPVIADRAEIAAIDFTGEEDLTKVDADYTIVFGGDGSILRAAHQMGERQLPYPGRKSGQVRVSGRYFAQRIAPCSGPTPE